MSNPTSNFNWQMPTNSDLVTDLPADFEVFGQAVDTSLADLKGGTTGQILSKATNTDMDFVWIANDQGDITGITATSPLTGGGTSGAVTVGIQSATTSQSGAVQLTDSTSSTSITTAATPNSVKSAYDPAFTNNFYAGKNKIINGDFRIWQRGTSFAVGSGTYTSDRWQSYNDGGTATTTQQTFTPGTAPVAGYEGTFFLRSDKTVAGGTFIPCFQRIEDVRTFAGQTVTVSFYAKAAAATSSGTVFIFQNFGSGGSGTVGVGSAAISVTTSWARYTATIAVPSISGKTIGTSSYLEIQALRFTDTLTRTIDIWGVQVEAGSVATPFQTATGTLQGELAACQRYYYRATTGNPIQTQASFGYSWAYSATATQAYIQFPVTMRTNASTTAEYASLQTQDIATAGWTTPTAVTYNSTTPFGAQVLFTGMAGLTSYRQYGIGSNGTNTAYIAFSAEL